MLRRQFLALAAAQRVAKKTPPKPPQPSWALWGGPNRDFRSPSKGLATSWPAEGPKRLWSRPLGDGYSAIAVEDGILYTMFDRGRQSVVTALDAASGKTIWESEFASPFVNAFQEKVGPGPYAMPQIIGPLVYVTGATGQLHALNKKTGERVWNRDLYREFNGTRLEFGYACHPLPYQNSLIVAAGGAGAAVIAFDQKDGRVLWMRHSFRNAHSSPQRVRVDGADQVVCLMAQEAIGLDPGTGDLLWQFKHPTEHGLAVATPVLCGDNFVFVTSAYGGGGRLLQLWNVGGKTGAKEVWYNNKVAVHFGSIIRDGGTLYCSSGQGTALLTAVEMMTGKILWQARDFAKAQLLAADGKLIVLDEDGSLGLVTATPRGLQVHAKAALLSAISWTPPTLAGTTLYARDRAKIMALDLG